MKKYDVTQVESLNKDIAAKFPQVFPIEDHMELSLTGVSRMVMLDRYTIKDSKKETFKNGDLVIVTVKEDPKFPSQGIGYIRGINAGDITIELEEEYVGNIPEGEELINGCIVRDIGLVEKPVELYYEQISLRNANNLGQNEEEKKAFYNVLSQRDFVPAGRVLFGAGSGSEVTYFNCYVMPFVQDSREGISDHRKQVMEIMSRGGGVGTNGSTLRPKRTLARGVNGVSSGSVSWLDDIAKLTHLVEQGGSRRGAQMIMLADWHPDVIEFVISKMQNPRILRYIIENIEDESIVKAAKNKLKFVALTATEIKMYEKIVQATENSTDESDREIRKEAMKFLKDGGKWEVENPEFLTGANISVAITSDFMKAVENDEMYNLRFPAVESYTKEEMDDYNNHWHEVGDVRKWEELGYASKVHYSIKAKDLWNLINICATYSAEPGIFFMDNANEMTNAAAYGQSVVATNPCGEQPLAPYSVCNLAAVNLAEMADKENKTVDYKRLIHTVKTGVRMQDNVIDSTPYFLEENKKQALGERRVGLGVMGLHDLLIYNEKRYGSEEGNELVDKVFEVIATTAYRESIELAKEKGSFPFLIGETDEETLELRKKFINSGYMKRMPEDIRQAVLKYGIRNSHLLTVAPTGSTGTMVGVSTGLEPYFSFSYYRSGRLGKFIEVKADIVQEYLDNNPGADENNLPEWFVSSMDLDPEEHVEVQAIIQRWVDSSISKTVNAPKGYQVEDVQKVYESLYNKGAKGGTVYVDGSRDSQVLTLKAEHEDMDAEMSLTEVAVSEEADVNMEQEKVKVTVGSPVKNLGSEIGDTCYVCEEGEVREIGGCNTCDSCGMMLKCGL